MCTRTPSLSCGIDHEINERKKQKNRGQRSKHRGVVPDRTPSLPRMELSLDLENKTFHLYL